MKPSCKPKLDQDLVPAGHCDPLMIDQATKLWMSMNLREGEEIEVINGFFKFKLPGKPGNRVWQCSTNANGSGAHTISAAAIIVVAVHMTRTASSTLVALVTCAVAAGIFPAIWSTAFGGSRD